MPARIDAARLRRRIGPYLLGIALAALASRGLAAIVPMEIAVGLGAVVSLGVPGWALVRVAGLDRRLGPAEAVAVLPVAGLIVWAPPLAAGFLLGLPFAVVLAAVLLLAAVGLAACEPFDFAAVDRAEAAGLTLAALAAGAVGWYYQAGIGAGDALFHAGRVRKLIELDGLSLTGVSTYLDGPPHAGYAFPLLHAAQAGAVKLGGGDPSVTYVSLVPVFVCLVPLAVYGAGKAVAGPSVGAAAALFACWDALVPGSWPLSLQWTEQPPTFTFVVLLPIGVLAAHELRRSPSDRSVQALSVAAVCVVAFVHPTYVFPLLAITTGIALLAWSGFRTLVVSYAAGAAILLWIWWEALHGAPPAGAFEPTYRSGVGTLFHHNAMLSGGSILQHRGPFLIAMLAMVVLLVAWGRRYALAAATMLGPFVLVALPGALAVLVPIVNLAQARRFWIAIPWPYVAALVVALIVARFAGRRIVWPLIAAVALSYLMRQDFHLLWTRWATELTSATAVAGLGIAIWQIATRRRAGPAPAVAAGVLPTLLVTAGSAQRAGGRPRLLAHGAVGPQGRQRGRDRLPASPRRRAVPGGAGRPAPRLHDVRAGQRLRGRRQRGPHAGGAQDRPAQAAGRRQPVPRPGHLRGRARRDHAPVRRAVRDRGGGLAHAGRAAGRSGAAPGVRRRAEHGRRQTGHLRAQELISGTFEDRGSARSAVLEFSVAARFRAAFVCPRSESDVPPQHAHDQPACPEAARPGAAEDQDPAPPRRPAEARRLHARVHGDPEEAELGASQGRPRAPDQR